MKNDCNSYKEVQKGTLLTKQLLKRSKQIIKNDNDVILIVDLLKNELEYNPYLLFFHKNKLNSKAYLASEFVSIEDGKKLIGNLNLERENRARNSCFEVPSNYNLELIKKTNSSQRIEANKVIDAIKVDENLNIQMNIRKSENIFILNRFKNSKEDSKILESCLILDTLQFALKDLVFNKTEFKIAYYTKDSNGRDICNVMILPNRSDWDIFYDEIWGILDKKI